MAAEMHEILRALGRIEGRIEGLQAEIVGIKAEQDDSKDRIQDKLERLVEDVRIVGAVAAQARDKADAVGSVVSEDVKPVTDDIKRIRLMGVGFTVAVGLVAGALGISIATWGQAALDWLRSMGKH